MRAGVEAEWVWGEKAHTQKGHGWDLLSNAGWSGYLPAHWNVGAICSCPQAAHREQGQHTNSLKTRSALWEHKEGPPTYEQLGSPWAPKAPEPRAQETWSSYTGSIGEIRREGEQGLSHALSFGGQQVIEWNLCTGGTGSKDQAESRHLEPHLWEEEEEQQGKSQAEETLTLGNAFIKDKRKMKCWGKL